MGDLRDSADGLPRHLRRGHRGAAAGLPCRPQLRAARRAPLRGPAALRPVPRRRRADLDHRAQPRLRSRPADRVARDTAHRHRVVRQAVLGGAGKRRRPSDRGREVDRCPSRRPLPLRRHPAGDAGAAEPGALLPRIQHPVRHDHRRHHRWRHWPSVDPGDQHAEGLGGSDLLHRPRPPHGDRDGLAFGHRAPPAHQGRRGRGVTLSPDAPLIHDPCRIENAQFGRYVEIGAFTDILNSEVGDYSYCSRHCNFANATIGKFANIASNVRIGATDHPLHTASLHHFLYRSASYWDDAEDDAEWFEKRARRRAVIGHDTWLGHGSQVKPDVTVGHGAVVASGAVVTKDVAPYEIVAGVPARHLRWRQPAQTAERLIAMAWWDWDHATLRAALPDFRALPAEGFLERYGG
ncbi:hypothetical protein HKCCE2091_19975 [Rhodobacterales bacterium HKCCE2091]|nr:hypothetical protein [Rhodobacterales bacterium HKCCE2091]